MLSASSQSAPPTILPPIPSLLIWAGGVSMSTPTLAHQVSVGPGTFSPTEARQGHPAKRPLPHRQATAFWTSPCSSCLGHTKTKLHICYIYAGRPRSSPRLFFGRKGESSAYGGIYLPWHRTALRWGEDGSHIWFWILILYHDLSSYKRTEHFPTVYPGYVYHQKHFQGNTLPSSSTWSWKLLYWGQVVAEAREVAVTAPIFVVRHFRVGSVA